MKIIRSKQRKSRAIRWLVALVIIIILAGGYLAYAMANNVQPRATQDPTSSSTVKSSVKSNDPTNNQLRSTTNPAPKTDKNTGKSTVVTSITSASVANSVLQIRVLIEYIAMSGSCEVTMSGPNGATYTESADIYTLPSSTTCKGFDIPTSRLSPGAWTITVNFASDDITGSASTEITL